MNTVKISRILAVIAITLLIVIPVLGIFQINVNAGGTTETAIENDSDYVFFVVDESKVPLAAAPVSNSASANTSVYWVVAATFIVVLGICYLSWYYMLLHNTSIIKNKLPAYLRDRHHVKSSIFHPIMSMENSADMAYDVAKKFFK